MSTTVFENHNQRPQGLKYLLIFLYPWIVWALASSFLLYKNFLTVVPSVMNDDLMRTFIIAGAATGNLVAFYFYSYTVMQIPVGIILDKFSTRYLLTIFIIIAIIIIGLVALF